MPPPGGGYERGDFAIDPTNQEWWVCTTGGVVDTWVVMSGSGGGVSSFNTRTGAVTLTKADVTGTGLTYSDVGADASGAAAAAQSAAEAASDPVGSATTAQTNAEAYADSTKLAKSSNLSDVASASTARTFRSSALAAWA